MRQHSRSSWQVMAARRCDPPHWPRLLVQALPSSRAPDGSVQPIGDVPAGRPFIVVAGAVLLFGVIAATLPPRPGPRQEPAEGIGAAEPLLAELERADRQWRPRVERLPDGGLRYWYRRQPDGTPLSLAEIRRLVTHPPSFAAERLAIISLLRRLQAIGVAVHLEPPRLAGAAAEWDPASRRVRIKPQVLSQGSRSFALVLNHEAIHVAQSCRGGSLGARPVPLGLSQVMPASLAAALHDPPYQQAGEWQKALEREAYANQHDLGLGLVLLEQHCWRG